MSVQENGKKFRDERAIQVINKCIGLKDDDIRKNNEILKEVLGKVIETMKENDEFFRDQFQNLVFVGSYYKGTKVGKPEEFDVNLIIKLPVNYDSIQFERGMPGCTKLKVNKADLVAPKWEKHRKILSKWVTAEGFLNQDEFRNWMESTLTRTVPKMKQNGSRTIKIQKSGPAFTFVITQNIFVHESHRMEMSVDLVPVLECNQNPPLPGNLSGANWYAVPKPIKNGQDVELNWRMSFWNREKSLLATHGNLKPVIRQMKKLRDTQGWRIIPSYHIETLFMHYTKEMKKNADLQKLAGTKLFIHMLHRLKEVCENQEMMNFWDATHNLIDAEKNQLAGIVGRLGKMIKQVTEEPAKMADWVLTAEELKIYEEELKFIPKQPVYTGPVAFPINLQAFKVKETKILEPEPTNGNNGSTEIMNMLRLIRKDIADVKNSVDLLSRRMNNVEQILKTSNVKEDAPHFDVTPAARSLMDYFFRPNNQTN